MAGETSDRRDEPLESGSADDAKVAREKLQEQVETERRTTGEVPRVDQPSLGSGFSMFNKDGSSPIELRTFEGTSGDDVVVTSGIETRINQYGLYGNNIDQQQQGIARAKEAIDASGAKSPENPEVRNPPPDVTQRHEPPPAGGDRSRSGDPIVRVGAGADPKAKSDGKTAEILL